MYNWNIWSVSVAVIACLLIAPILAIFYSAFVGDTSLWPHLFSTVLPRYVSNTLLLMLGVGCLSLVFGISTAWVVTRYNFLSKSFFEWALLLPAAVPAYIIAYTYTDIFEYAGPVQGMLRDFLVGKIHKIIGFLIFALWEGQYLLWPLFYILIFI